MRILYGYRTWDKSVTDRLVYAMHMTGYICARERGTIALFYDTPEHAYDAMAYTGHRAGYGINRYVQYDGLRIYQDKGGHGAPIYHVMARYYHKATSYGCYMDRDTAEKAMKELKPIAKTRLWIEER